MYIDKIVETKWEDFPTLHKVYKQFLVERDEFMDLQDELLEKKITKESIQFNSQDLDQEQKVDVNPMQLNTQNIHIYVNNDNNNYSGKITGVTYLERNRNIIGNVKIYLFFGHEYRFPVFEIYSDNTGNFTIDNLPSGYYTLFAKLGDLEYSSHYIKLLPCQTIHESLLLKSLFKEKVE